MKKLNRKVLKIVICSLVLLIGIGAVSAAEYGSPDDAAALKENGQIEVISDDAATAGDVLAAESDAVLDVEGSDAAQVEVPAAESDEIISGDDDASDVSKDVDHVSDEEDASAPADDVEVVADGDACEAMVGVDDAELVDGSHILCAVNGNAFSASVIKDLDLAREPDKNYVGYGSAYKTFKGKSEFKWKIKKSKWYKMKKQAKKRYWSLHKRGSSLPGYSNGVSVKVNIYGYKCWLTAYAVKNHRGIRCEVRGLNYGYRLSTWGDYYA